MTVVVYLLCAMTSFLCAGLLMKAYSKTKSRLQLWVAICFIGLALNNILLVVDFEVVPTVDLTIARTVPALLGLIILIIGLVWETGKE